MLVLNPFVYDERFSLTADLEVQGSELLFSYVLSDPMGLFESPSHDTPSCETPWRADEVPRRLGLWENTCFEAFLQPLGLTKYYEFNFSLRPAWNGFQFESYRQPQPLMETPDFGLQKMEWKKAEGRLQVRVENRSPFGQFKVGLTAVLKEKNQKIHYCSLAHQGPKPDFHRADDFILVRGDAT